MTLTRLAAQGLVDGLAALALAVLVLSVARQGPASALRSRLGFAAAVQCLFYAFRAADDLTDIGPFGLLTLVMVCLIPPAGLVLTEGVLRRHAPRALKAFVLAGAVGAAAVLVATGGRQGAPSWVLGAYVVSSLGFVTVLLLTRDRASLSRQENANVDALVIGGVLVTLTSVTDFAHTTPVGLSGVGAAALAFVLGANPGSAGEARRVLVDLASLTVTAIAAAFALGWVLGFEAGVQTVRLAAILLALLLAATALLAAGRRRERGQAKAFAQALAEADLAGLDRFLESLADQPLLADLRLAQDGQLADYDQAGLAAALGSRTVWTHAALAEAAIETRARDELADLMTRTESTHAVMLSPTPLRIALLTLPGAGSAGEAEIHLALFRRLAAVAAQNRP